MEKLRIGVIGPRARMSISTPWQKSGKAEVAVALDTRAESLEAFKTKVNPDAYVTTDTDEFFARKDIDAIAIFSPDFTHEKYVIRALENGKHVFCEKPMAITVEGCDRMLEAWHKSGCKFMVGHNMRYMGEIRTMKEIVQSGVIGEVKTVWCRHFINYGGTAYFHDWHAAQEKANTLLLQKGSHDIDVIHWLANGYSKQVAGFGGLDYFGGDKPNDLTCVECKDRETCVEAQLSTSPNWRQLCAFRNEVNVEDNQMIFMNLDNGVRACYLQCHFAPDAWRNYAVIGTEGRVENLANGSIRVLTRHSNTWREYTNRTYEAKPPQGEHGGADALEAMDFIRLVTEGVSDSASPIAARMAVATGCAGAQSIRNGGQPVTVAAVPANLL